MQTVLPALHQSTNDLQVVAKNGSFGVEAVLHQKLQQAVRKDFISGVSLEEKKTYDVPKTGNAMIIKPCQMAKIPYFSPNITVYKFYFLNDGL